MPTVRVAGSRAVVDCGSSQLPPARVTLHPAGGDSRTTGELFRQSAPCDSDNLYGLRLEEQIVESGQRRLGALCGSDDHPHATDVVGVSGRENAAYTGLQTAIEVDLLARVRLEKVEGVDGA